MELVAASSPIDAGIGFWDLTTGKEQLRYKACASPPHGLVCVGHRFLASSQLRESAGSVQYWSWSKPQVDVKSHPAEPIKPLAANSAGTYIVGGGVSGNIYLWEVSSGRLLKKWPAHYRAVSCLVFSDDDSLLISGSEDGGVRVWSLIQLFDDEAKRGHLYLYDFMEHSLSVTDVVIGFGGGNAVIVSASEDRTCKIRSLSNGRLLRDIVFPSIIDAIALDPAEQVFYAGGRDGKIYVAALNAPSSYNSKYGLHIIGCFSNQSKAVTCLAYGITGNYLISGSEDGRVRVWDARTHNLVRMFQHAKGPVNNILVIRLRQQLSEMNSQASSKRHGSLLPPPLEKYPTGEDADIKVLIGGQNTCSQPPEALYVTSHVMESQIRDLQQQGSASSEMEIDKLKREQQRLIQNNQQLKRLYDNLHEFMVNDLFNRDQADTQNGSSA